MFLMDGAFGKNAELCFTVMVCPKNVELCVWSMAPPTKNTELCVLDFQKRRKHMFVDVFRF